MPHSWSSLELAGIDVDICCRELFFDECLIGLLNPCGLVVTGHRIPNLGEPLDTPWRALALEGLCWEIRGLLGLSLELLGSSLELLGSSLGAPGNDFGALGDDFGSTFGRLLNPFSVFVARAVQAST